jgi:hypothetical protein
MTHKNFSNNFKLNELNKLNELGLYTSHHVSSRQAKSEYFIGFSIYNSHKKI